GVGQVGEARARVRVHVARFKLPVRILVLLAVDVGNFLVRLLAVVRADASSKEGCQPHTDDEKASNAKSRAVGSPRRRAVSGGRRAALFHDLHPGKGTRSGIPHRARSRQTSAMCSSVSCPEGATETV